MKYYFYFGYHNPSSWNEFRIDPDFDFESTGVILIEAENEDDALLWGRTIAFWYLNKLHKNNDYAWRSENYANWVEEENKSTFDEAVLNIKAGYFPNYVDLKRHLKD